MKLYLDGKIREWYSRGDGKGVIVLFDVKTEDEARAIVEKLPLTNEVRSHLAQFFKKELKACAARLDGPARKWPAQYGF